EQLARDVERTLLIIAGDERKARDEASRAVERFRDCGRAFFSAVTFGHRGDGRPKREERVRVTASSLAEAADTAGNLCGALSLVASILTRLRQTSGTQGKGPANGGGAASDRNAGRETQDETIDTLVRRCGELETDLRFLLRADDTGFVYFVEFRGRGVFLRASPIDVS